jgi:hypothetical protein
VSDRPTPAWRHTAALAGVYLLVRLAYLSSSLEETINNDELTTGLLWRWLNGARALPVEALWSPRMGGDALYQLLALPLYAILGDSALTVKALALMVGLAGLVVVVAVARSQGGPRAGVLAGLLYTLAPPGWVGLGLVGTGDHLLSGILTVLCGGLLLSARDAAPPRRGRLLAGLGLVAGIALFANYLFAVAWIALVMLALIARPRRPWKARDLPPLGGGLALGLAPLVTSLFARGLSASTTMYGRRGGAHLQTEPLSVLADLLELLGSGLAGSAWFPPTALGQAAAWAWWGLVVTLVLATLWLARGAVASLLTRGEGPRVGLELFLLLFAAGFGGAFALSHFGLEPWRLFGYRYLAALIAPLCALLGLSLARLPRPFTWATGALWWIPALVALSWPGVWRDPLRVRDLPGVTWTNAAGRALEAWGPDLEGAFATKLPLIPEEDRGPFLVSLGKQMFRQPGPPRAARSLTPRWRTHLHRGMQESVALCAPPADNRGIGAWLERCWYDQPESAWAMGRLAPEQMDRSTQQLAHALGALPPEGITPFCEGMGGGVVDRHKTLTDLARWRVPWDELLAPGCQAAFDTGLRTELDRLYRADPAYRAQVSKLFELGG